MPYPSSTQGNSAQLAMMNGAQADQRQAQAERNHALHQIAQLRNRGEAIPPQLQAIADGKARVNYGPAENIFSGGPAAATKAQDLLGGGTRGGGAPTPGAYTSLGFSNGPGRGQTTQFGGVPMGGQASAASLMNNQLQSRKRQQLFNKPQQQKPRPATGAGVSNIFT